MKKSAPSLQQCFLVTPPVQRESRCSKQAQQFQGPSHSRKECVPRRNGRRTGDRAREARRVGDARDRAHGERHARHRRRPANANASLQDSEDLRSRPRDAQRGNGRRGSPSADCSMRALRPEANTQCQNALLRRGPSERKFRTCAMRTQRFRACAPRVSRCVIIGSSD